MKTDKTSRRDFLKNSAWTAGGITTLSSFTKTNPEENLRLPREIWITTVSQKNIRAKNSYALIDEILILLNENAEHYHPDVVCLPEIFPFTGIEATNITLHDKIRISKDVLGQFSVFAKKHGSYVVCPVYTAENGKSYNSAVVFDRNGNNIGEYRKIYITEGEIKAGLTPGPIDPPVFQTDFGKIGIQICYDIMWDDGWKKLREKGVDVIFWPSAFSGGKMVDAKAWQNMCVVVSSTWNANSKICDITGETISETGKYDENIVCAPVNLEKAFLHSWPYSQRFDEIRKKYGRKIVITTYHEEEWSIIESRSPEVFVADILEEFNLKSKNQLLKDSEQLQNKARL